jgi:heparosan-N-sulfate-glucuronate 5-epimerase
MLSRYIVDYTKTKISPRFGPLDATGIPLFDPKFVRLKGKPVYHPIVIIQYGLANHDLALEGNKEAENIFLNCASWLTDHVVEEPEKRFMVWYYPFRMLTPPVSPPWVSGMAQGQALSLLARAYQITGSSHIAQIAHGAAGSFRYELQDGGILSKTAKGDYFIEELAYQPAIHILNGSLYAVFGLYEYLTVFPNAILETILEKCIRGIEEVLPAFDLGWWSRYSLGIRLNLATFYYHDIHIILLRHLGSVFHSYIA